MNSIDTMHSIDEALHPMGAITLDGANEIAELQTRVDRKYVLDAATLGALLGALPSTAVALEVDGERSCRYRSTYFDTDDLALYRAAVQGRRVRYKVRSRRYGDTGPCFLEVKAKGRRGANVKSRISYDRDRHDTITTDGQAFIQQITGDRGLDADLQPVLTTEYARSTIIDPATQTRLTFDRHLRCSAGPDGDAVLDAIVVETKSAQAPSPADHWLWKHQIRPTKISKFCTGLAAIRPDLAGNKWHRVVARHWHREPTCAR